MSAPVGTPQAPDTASPVRSLLRRLGSRLAGTRVGGRLTVRWSRVTWLALMLISAQMLLRTWATSRSWFMWDDYIFIADVTRGDTGFAWLFHSHFSLVQPIGFGLAWIVGVAGLSWSAYAINILLMQLLASLACWWMLRVLFGDRRLILLPLLFYLFVPLTVPASVWWSVAIYQYPHQIAIFGSIAGHVMYLRSGRKRHLAVALAFLLLGLGSYLKAPLILLVLVGISWLWFTDGPMRQRMRQMARTWPAWLVYAAAVGGYVALWLHQQTGGLARRSCELPGALQNSLFDTVSTSLVGGPWHWTLWTGGIDPFIAASRCAPQAYRGNPDLVVGGAPQSLASPVLAGIVVAWLLLGFLVLHRWARHVNAVRSLWILTPYVLLSALLVYVGRAATFGSQVGAREIRYFSDVAVIVAFALGTALMPIVGARVAVARRAEPYITAALPPTLVRTLVVLFMVGSVTSTIAYVLPWHSTSSSTTFPERTFIAQVEADLNQTPGRVRVADVPFPARIANPVIAPYNLPSRKLAPLAPKLRGVLQGTDLDVIDGDGDIRPATIPDGPRARTGPVEDCGYLVQTDITRVGVAGVLPGPYWTRIDYLANADGFVDVIAGQTRRRIDVEKGLHQLLFLTEGDFTGVWMRADLGLSMCVDNIHVGPVVPKEETP